MVIFTPLHMITLFCEFVIKYIIINIYIARANANADRYKCVVSLFE